MHNNTFVELQKDKITRWFHLTIEDSKPILKEALSISVNENGNKLFNGEPKENGNFFQVGHMNKIIDKGKEVENTGSVNPLEFLTIIGNSEVVYPPYEVHLSIIFCRLYLCLHGFIKK